MSIRLMTKIWDSDAYAGGTLIVLLALADWAADDGSRIFPKVRQLCEKSRLSERQVRRCLGQLLNDGTLSLVRAATGKPGVANEYQLNVALLPVLGPTDVSDTTDSLHGGQNGTPETGAIESPRRGPSCPETGAIHAAHIDKPSSTPSRDTSRRASRVQSDLLEEEEKPKVAKKGTRWPSDREVPDEWLDAGAARRARAGLPAIDLRATAAEFVTYWPGLPPGPKALKSDWKATFENACIRARAPFGPYQRFGVVEGGARAPNEPVTIATWVTRLKMFAGDYADGGYDAVAKGTWPQAWGPKPGALGCLVPKEATAEFNAKWAHMEVRRQ